MKLGKQRKKGIKKKMPKKTKIIIIAIAAIVTFGSVFGSNEDPIKPVDTVPVTREPVATLEEAEPVVEPVTTPEKEVVEPVTTPEEVEPVVEIPVYNFEKDGELLTSEQSPLTVGQEVIIEGILTMGNSRPGQKTFAVAMSHREGTGDDEEVWAISFVSPDSNLTFYGTQIGDFVRIKGTVKAISFSTLIIENCIVWE